MANYLGIHAKKGPQRNPPPQRGVRYYETDKARGEAKIGLSGPAAALVAKASAVSSPRAGINKKDCDIARTQENPAVNASGGAISRVPGQDHGRCRTCYKRFEAYRVHQVYCSPRCRLLAWAWRQFVRDYKAGRLPGFKAEVDKLR